MPLDRKLDPVPERTRGQLLRDHYAAASHAEPRRAAASPQQPRKHRPWGWIAVCALLVIVAAGLGVWALGLQSDLDDQKGQTAQGQQDAEQASSQVSALQGQLDQISQGVSDASDQLAHAGEDAQQHARDALTGLQERLADLREQIQQASADAEDQPDTGGNDSEQDTAGQSTEGEEETDATP